MHTNTSGQVTTPQNTTRRTTRMARKGRVPVCPNTKQQVTRPPTTATMTTTTTATDAKTVRCMRPGPMQRNPYLNFLRDFRKKCYGLPVVETVRRGAQAWKCLTAEQKAQYIVQAFYTRKNRFRNVNRADRRRPRKSKKKARSKKTKSKAIQTNRRSRCA